MHLIKTANIADELAAAEIRSALQGKRCWYAYTSVGCTFAMDLGRKIPRDDDEIAAMDRLRKRMVRQHPRGVGPLEREHLRFKGESHLLVWCSWRIEDAKGPLASSDSDAELCEKVVRRLIGKTVQVVEIRPGWDLRLDLSSGLTVAVFPDHVGPEANFDGNWELWRPDQAYLIGTDLACDVMDRENRRLRPQPQKGRWQVKA